MSYAFHESLELQELPTHIRFLKSKGYNPEDQTSGNLKLRDLYDRGRDAWFECKNDRSQFTHRVMVEVFANVPVGLLAGLPQRMPLEDRYVQKLLVPKLGQLAKHCRYYAWGTDPRIEARHYVSYLWRFGSHVLLDLRQVRQQLCRNRHEWIIVGYEGDSWRNVCALVQTEDLKPL